MAIPMRTIPGYENSVPGIQVGTKLEGKYRLLDSGDFEFDEDGIRFLQQIGVEWVMASAPPEYGYREFLRMREQLEEKGLKIYRLANNRLHNMPSVTLGLEDRDKWIDDYLKYISDLGRAGIHYATYAHMGNGIWRSDMRREIRGGATAGGLDFALPNAGHWGGITYTSPMSHGRLYGEDELWENYEYFIKKVVPVAEEYGVYIGIHPDDPPVFPVGGIPRSIFGTFDGYKRAIEIADSPNIGTCLCVGCWLEGGCGIGCTPEEFIKYFGERKKLFKLHVRNVTGALDMEGGFNETFPDAGYYNLVNVIQALDDIDFDGAIMNDHLVDMVGGHLTAEAYCTSYLKGAVAGIQNHRLK